MPKTIVAIDSDPAVQLIKCFRNINLQAGKAKKNRNEFEYMQACVKLQVLAAKAEEMGFHIWVNQNGKTGHDYDKDYKDTPDIDNDFEAFIAAATERMQQNMIRMTEQIFSGQRRIQAN